MITQRAFKHRRVCTQKRLHREAFTQELLHTRAFTFTHRSCYTQTLLHKEVFTQRALTHGRVYRQKLLHKEVFTQRASTHGSFHTQKSLHREVCTQRRFYTKWKGEIGSNSLGKTLRRSFREQAFLTCSKDKNAVPLFHEYVQKSIRNIFLKQQVVIQ